LDQHNQLMPNAPKVLRPKKTTFLSTEAPPSQRRRSRFASGLAKEWNRLNLPEKDLRVIVAVSGGADSTALLLALHELWESNHVDPHIVVAHLDHGLRGKAGANDARAVRLLAERLGVEVKLGRKPVKELAQNSGDNLEQAARRARYDFLAKAAEKCESSLVLTGHTLDDQAETVLLRLLRGSGAEGLGGIEPVRTLASSSETLLVRPLVSWARRSQTEAYCHERGVAFAVDQMNLDERFARVRVRRQLLPLMETFNPRVVESLARSAELLREDAAVLNIAAETLLVAATAGLPDAEYDATSETAPLLVDVLVDAPLAIRRRALRLWLESARGDLRRIELVHLTGIEKLLIAGRGGRVAELPGGAFVERRRSLLRFYMK
jgi:tRNA(Ile)-lysidine synthase